MPPVFAYRSIADLPRRRIELASVRWSQCVLFTMKKGQQHGKFFGESSDK